MPQMTAYELVSCGAGEFMGDGSVITHCRKHTKEEITDALARDLRFHRASQERIR